MHISFDLEIKNLMYQKFRFTLFFFFEINAVERLLPQMKKILFFEKTKYCQSLRYSIQNLFDSLVIVKDCL